jgi:regulator of sigma E protease
MLTLLAFTLALALLIAVHEYGHYRMAVACGVKVLRFSIGFGKTLIRWQPRGSGTEFVVAMLPLGGYVKMLDEREAPVDASERHLAFNTQPLRSRVAIVAAGPLANLLLAVALYAVVNWSGVQQPAPVLASPEPGSVADLAGLKGGERVQRVGLDGEALEAVQSFEELRWFLTRAALDSRDVRLALSTSERSAAAEVVLKLSGLEVAEPDAELFRKIGVQMPFSRPVIGEVAPGSPAAKAGLKKGDLVQQIGGVAVVDGQQLRHRIRGSVLRGEPVTADWRVERDGKILALRVTPEVKRDGELEIGRVGAYVGEMPESVMVRQGLVQGVWLGITRTWEVSVLTLKMMGRMLVGEASLKNLSGPLTIADYAGKSAGLGISQYLLFLALISVSLGVLNLLPLPVLDGGHLMYYLWEGVSGRPVSDVWTERLQKGGVAILLGMTSIALFNDITRLFG